MEQYKLDFFKKDHKKQNLSFVSLYMEECDKVFASFCLSYKIAPLYRNDIFSIIQSEGRFVNSVNAKDENFDLRRLIYEQNIKEMPKHVNVCWDSFYTIDAFDFKDVADFFDYIWYPSADDIILFDESYKVCFMVRHDGAVYQFDKK